MIASYTIEDGKTRYTLAFQAMQDDAEWEWKFLTIKEAFQSLGVIFGVMVDGSDDLYHMSVWEGKPYLKKEYAALISNHVGGMMTSGGFYQSTFEKERQLFGRVTTSIFYVEVARDNGLWLLVHPGFDKYDVSYLKETATKGEFLAKMQGRVVDIFDILANSKYQNPIIVNIFNEPFRQYHDTPNIVGWKTDTLFYEKLGENFLIESYRLFYEEAKRRGLEPGKDVLFIFNEYGIHVPNKKVSFLQQVLPEVKSGIAQRLNISPEEVQLGIGIEMRFDKNQRYYYPTDQGGRFRPPTADELTSVTEYYVRNFWPVLYTEISYANADVSDQALIFELLAEVAYKHNVNGLFFEMPFSFRKKGAQNVNLFRMEGDKVYPGPVYYSLVNLALTLER